MAQPKWQEVRLLPCPRFRPVPGDLFDDVCDCGWLEADHDDA